MKSLVVADVISKNEIMKHKVNLIINKIATVAEQQNIHSKFMIGPVKHLERSMAKFEEYSDELQCEFPI